MAGADQINMVLTLLAILVWAFAFRILWAAREGILWVLKAAVFGAIGFVITLAVLPHYVSRPEAIVGSYGVAGILVALAPRRSRYIPARERRRVVARHEARTGRKLNPRREHIDHTWPFSRGGSNTADNLRVIPKKENLRKGAKKPRLRDWL